jgi:hypothetical protein
VRASFPRNPADVTTEWLTAVLGAPGGACPGARVATLEATPVGTGQMGTSVRYALAWSPPRPGAPRSVVCKFASPDPLSRETGLRLRTYEVEVEFYRLLAPTVGIRTPACHFADIDLASGEFVLVLEDLAPAEQGNQLAGCTVTQAALALDELAKLHAPRWGDERLARLAWLDRNTPDALALSSVVLPALLPGFLDRYAARLAPEHVAVAERLMARLGRWLADREPPFVVQHGDYRVDNMLFGTTAGGVPLAVVDWQTAVRGSPLGDVAYFLGGSLPTEIRRAHERALVRTYWDTIRCGGAGGFSWERCWSDYRKFTPAGLLMAICASMLVVQTERGDAMFLTMARRHATHVLDLDGLEFLPA